MKKGIKKAMAVVFGVLAIGVGAVACGKNSENTDNIGGEGDSNVGVTEPFTPIEFPTAPEHEHIIIHIDGVEPTCEESGYDEYWRCEECKEILTEDGIITTVRKLPALGHSYDKSVIAVGCTTNGYTEYTCSACGDTYRDETVKATGHKYEEEEITKQPTCTSEGERVLRCRECGEIRTEQIAKEKHRYETTEIAATCEEGGYIKYICRECGEEREEKTSEAEGHDYGETEVEATCERGGYILYECAVCGDEYTEQTSEPLGHRYTVEEVQPTCTDGGYTEHTCAVCGYSYRDEITEPNGHKWDEEILIRATCKTAGKTKYTCKVCNTTRTEETRPTEHKYSETYSYDERQHWRKAECECEETERKEHEIENGECAVCGYRESLEYYDSGDGTLTVTGKGTITAKEIEIPSEYRGKRVIGIADGAFSGDRKITSVKIGGSVEYIGKEAFAGCTAIRKIEFEETSGWYYTKSEGATTGTKLTITATVYLELTTSKSDYYFKRKSE